MSPTREMLARMVGGDVAAAFDVGVRLAEQRPLPPCEAEPCESCVSWDARGYPCQVCNGTRERWRCTACGGYHDSGGPKECRC